MLGYPGHDALPMALAIGIPYGPALRDVRES